MKSFFSILFTLFFLVCFADNWSEPQTLGSGNFDKVFINSKNQAIALWQDVQNSNRINAMYSSDGGKTFQNPLVDIDENDVKSFEACMNESGHAVAVWEHTDGSIKLKYSKDAGKNWLSPSLGSALSNSGSNPVIAINNNDVVLMAWKESNDFLYSISFDGGDTWNSSQIPIETDGTSLNIALNDNSFAIAIWKDQTTGNILSKYMNLKTDSTWKTPSSAIPSKQGLNPQLAINSKNHAIVLFSSQSQYKIYTYYSLDAGDTWNNIDHPGQSGNAKILLTDSDSVISFWNNESILYTMYLSDFSSSFKEPITGSLLSLFVSRYDVAMKGNFAYVCWLNIKEQTLNLSSSSDIGVNWSEKEILSKQPLCLLSNPKIAVNSSNNAVAMWTLEDWKVNSSANFKNPKPRIINFIR
ncbi:MAG: exo-alpha-sialidase [Parachlamydiales bacterium]|nr:exo-alpha-sialidase [Parachlamydiales bacterium]